MGGDGEDDNKGALHGQGRRCLLHFQSRIEGEDSGGFPVPATVAVGMGFVVGGEVGVKNKEKEEGALTAMPTLTPTLTYWILSLNPVGRIRD